MAKQQELLRKWGLFLLIVSLAASMLPGMAAALAGNAQYVNTDSATQGDWVGAYGSDGYVLPFFTSNRTSEGRDNPPAADMTSLPSYVDSYSVSGNVSYWQSNVDVASALQLPDGSGRKKIEVYTGGNFTYSFQLNDNNPHLFTVYTTDFGSGASGVVRFEILDAGNQVLASREVDAVGNGKYASFYVQGSFKIKVTKVSGTRAFAQGFFFDSPVPLTAQGLTASSLHSRSAELQWTNSSGGSVAVLRKLQEETEFVKIAETAAGVNSYVDDNLLPGKQYEYALQNIAGSLYSLPTDPVSYTTSVYDAASLVLSQTAYTVEAPGQSVELIAVLTDENDDPVAGYPVNFELQGEYVGTYIDQEIGEAETDANGVASLMYTPPYAGQFEIRAWTEPNDIDLLDAAEASAALDVEQPQWELPPLLMRATDAVKPGMLFQVTGHAMNAVDWDDVTAVIEPLASAGMTPSTEAVELEIVQKDELRGQFMHLLFPSSVAPGSYRLWVSNEHGWSEPIDLNSPRPLFISEYEVFEGLSIDISGRNFQAREFDANADTKVRLRDGSSAAYAVPIVHLTPYSLRFLVDDVPLGEYDVQVSNDGGQTWKGLQSGQTLTVVAPGEDPLGLGVAWADHFEWNNRFDVTDYGAIADDGNDDTAAIAAAVAAAKDDGGGVVFLPAGTFHASVVQLPSRIVLMGDGPESTLLYHIGGKQNFIQAAGDGKTEGRTGIARIGLRAADDTMYPDAFIWLGHDWGSAVDDLTLRTASELFVVETGIEYPVLDPVDTSEGSGRGQGMLTVGDERIVIKDNRMVGWAAQYNRIYMNRYVHSTGNYAEYSFSQMPITADYTFIRDNEFVIRGEADVEVHGIGVKSNSHVENNIVRTTGAGLKTTYNNDGESIFAEMPGAYFAVGDVLGATADTVTLAPIQPLPEPIILRRGALSVVIVDGTGLGQYREVQYTSGTTYSLTKEWDVIPDRTSKFSLIAPNDNITVYRNQTIDGQRGIWLYGNAIDAVVADNKLVNTDGIYIASTGAVQTNRYTPTYFVNVKGNQLLGTPGTGHASGIIAVSNRRDLDGRFYATGIYGIEINDNYLYGSQELISTPRHQKFSGIVSSAATLSSDSNPVFTPEDRDNLNMIIANNRLEHMADGLVLMSGLYGHTAQGNQFTDVVRDVYERYGEGTSRLLELEGVYTDRRAPYWPTMSKLQVELSANDTAELSWEPAEDIVGVTNYLIYANGTLLDETDANTTSFTADSLLPGTKYEFAVTAKDAVGNTSYAPLSATVATEGGSSSSEGSLNAPPPQAGNSSNGPELHPNGYAVVKLDPEQEGQTGVATATADTGLISDALTIALPDGQGIRRVQLDIGIVEDADGYAITLPTAVGCTATADPYRLELKTAVAAVDLPCEWLQAAADAGEETLRLVVGEAEASKRSNDLTQRIGARPAIELQAFAGEHPFAWADDARVTITIPYEPNEAERRSPAKLVVWRVDGEGAGSVSPSGRYVPEAEGVVSRAGSAGVYAIGYGQASFGDLTGYDWAKTPIEALAVRNVISGTALDSYSPGASIKRADFVLLLARLLELEGASGETFADVDSHDYYYDAVSAAQFHGIVAGGGDNRFRPEETITRQDMIVMAARALRSAGALQTGTKDIHLQEYGDHEAVSDYAREDFARLVALGIVQGSDGQLSPLAATTRAQAAVLIYRMMEQL